MTAMVELEAARELRAKRDADRDAWKRGVYGRLHAGVKVSVEELDDLMTACGLTEADIQAGVAALDEKQKLLAVVRRKADHHALNVRRCRLIPEARTRIKELEAEIAVTQHAMRVADAEVGGLAQQISDAEGKLDKRFPGWQDEHPELVKNPRYRPGDDPEYQALEREWKQRQDAASTRKHKFTDGHLLPCLFSAFPCPVSTRPGTPPPAETAPPSKRKGS